MQMLVASFAQQSLGLATDASGLRCATWAPASQFWARQLRTSCTVCALRNSSLTQVWCHPVVSWAESGMLRCPA